MMKPHSWTVVASRFATLALLAACMSDGTTNPTRAARSASFDRPAPPSTPTPSGERQFGQATVEPAYNDETGSIIYLLTPDKVPFPSKANGHATAPLYLVEYPPGTTVTGFNCAGVPGNCPDHDLDVATAATNIMPSVYGTNPFALPGHDHLVAAPGSGGDFNVAWEVVEVLFTKKSAANTRLTTDDEVDAAVKRGDAIKVDLGFAFNCNVVPATVYWNAKPVD